MANLVWITTLLKCCILVKVSPTLGLGYIGNYLICIYLKFGVGNDDLMGLFPRETLFVSILYVDVHV